MTVSCVESSGRETAKRFSFDWLTQPPVITLNTLPQDGVLKDPRSKRVSFIVKTDNPSVCKFTRTSSTGGVSSSYLHHLRARKKIYANLIHIIHCI